jgi:hypothetical protein
MVDQAVTHNARADNDNLCSIRNLAHFTLFLQPRFLPTAII